MSRHEPASGATPVRDTLRRLMGDTLIYGAGRIAGYAAAILLMPVYTHFLADPDEYGIVINLELFLALAARLIGSTTDRVLKLADRPVLAVPPTG